jgi:hypothetical protein
MALAGSTLMVFAVAAVLWGMLRPPKAEPHFAQLCRRNLGQATRMCTHWLFPLASVTRAIPL